MTRLALFTIAFLIAASQPGLGSPIREDDVDLQPVPDSSLTIYGLEAAERAVSDSVMAPLDEGRPSVGGLSRERAPKVDEPEFSTRGFDRSRASAQSASDDVRDANPQPRGNRGTGSGRRPQSEAHGPSIDEILRGLETSRTRRTLLSLRRMARPTTGDRRAVRLKFHSPISFSPKFLSPPWFRPWKTTGRSPSPSWDSASFRWSFKAIPRIRRSTSSSRRPASRSHAHRPRTTEKEFLTPTTRPSKPGLTAGSPSGKSSARLCSRFCTLRYSIYYWLVA